MRHTVVRSLSRSWAFALCLVLVAGTPGRAHAQASRPGLVVFGTSLSDPGNAFALAKIQATPPDFSLDQLLVPSAPYAKGGHHLSNGATWVEQLGLLLGLEASVRPAFQVGNSRATNFAIAGAHARNDGLNPTLPFEVSAFLQQAGGIAPSDALYIIEMGSNDVRDAVEAIAGGGDGAAIIGQALTSIASQIGVLYGAGARNFLVLNVPNIGLTPALQIANSQSPGAAQLATFVTQVFNANLTATLGQVAALPGIHIVPFDLYALINQIVATPAAFGLTNVASACLTPFVPPYSCQSPDEYLFWDGVHPTKAAHGIIAESVADFLSQ